MDSITPPCLSTSSPDSPRNHGYAPTAGGAGVGSVAGISSVRAEHPDFLIEPRGLQGWKSSPKILKTTPIWPKILIGGR